MKGFALLSVAIITEIIERLRLNFRMALRSFYHLLSL